MGTNGGQYSLILLSFFLSVLLFNGVLLPLTFYSKLLFRSMPFSAQSVSSRLFLSLVLSNLIFSPNITAIVLHSSLFSEFCILLVTCLATSPVSGVLFLTSLSFVPLPALIPYSPLLSGDTETAVPLFFFPFSRVCVFCFAYFIRILPLARRLLVPFRSYLLPSPSLASLIPPVRSFLTSLLSLAGSDHCSSPQGRSRHTRQHIKHPEAAFLSS